MRIGRRELLALAAAGAARVENDGGSTSREALPDDSRFVDTELAQIPRCLRSASLELLAVKSGAKPACRLSLASHDLRTAYVWLDQQGLVSVVEDSVGFRSSGVSRQRVGPLLRSRVYVARSQQDARQIAVLEREGNYEALGIALGYPECCVQFAVHFDQLWSQATHWRQANLHARAIVASREASFICNTFLQESALGQFGPTTAISHYPCNLNCSASIALGRAYLTLGARKWPIFTHRLTRLLASPTIYWSDEAWPPQYADECAGLALVDSRAGERGWYTAAGSILLGAERTPLGRIPRDVVAMKVSRSILLFVDGKGSQVSWSTLGESLWLVDWGAQSLTSLRS